jgi:peptidoglycan/LPS O-acetylase OafA/YrhL
MTLPHSGLLVGTGSGAVCLLQLPVFAGIAHVLVYTANAMVAAGLVASAVLCGRDGMLSQWWRQPWLAWAGRYSYGIYVIHTVVLWRLLHTFPFRHDVLHATMWFAAYVVGSAALAVVSRRLLEDPFLRLKVFFNSNGASATAASGSKPLQTAN